MAISTLHNYLDGRYEVHATCEACQHHAVIDLAPLVGRYGHLTLPELRQRLVGSECRSKDIHVNQSPPRPGRLGGRT